MASWLLLAVGVLAVLFGLNAYRPVRRNVVLGLPSFFASWLTIELAWVHLVLGLVVTGLLVWAGALDRWAGWVGLVLVAAWFVTMAVMVLWSRGAAGAAAEALGDLGDGVVEPPRHRVRRTRNVPFARVAGRVLRLDVYAPEAPAPPGERRPALLQVHGGAWVIGDKREQGIPLLRHLAARGWVCFNANYRLSPGATWPDHLVDLKRALAFVRAHADEYGIDPAFVAVTGGSAGGHLAAMLALTPDDPRYQPGFEAADTSVQAAVPFYGVYDFTNRFGTMPRQFRDWILQPMVVKAFYDEDPAPFVDASPLDRVRPDACPFFVIHGDNDTLAPVEDARRFVEALRGVSGAPVVYLELRGAQHAFDVFTSIRTRRVVRAVGRFLTAVHGQWAGEGHGPVGDLDLARPEEAERLGGAASG